MDAGTVLAFACLLALLVGAPWARGRERVLGALAGATAAGVVAHALLGEPAATLAAKLAGGALGALGPGAGSGGRRPVDVAGGGATAEF